LTSFLDNALSTKALANAVRGEGMMRSLATVDTNKDLHVLVLLDVSHVFP